MVHAGLPPNAAYAANATRDWVLGGLQDSELRLFLFNGHGGMGMLALAAREHVSGADIESLCWKGAPFFHLDCCLAGANWGRGGGRFTGLPALCLQRGASAVLASFHALYDRPAADFSMELYRAMLQRDATLGVALLEARAEVHSRYGNNPLLWASSILWGNPEVRLREP
jgi:hypothetical protein